MIYAELLLLFFFLQSKDLKIKKSLTYMDHMKYSLISYTLVRKQQSR